MIDNKSADFYKLINKIFSIVLWLMSFVVLFVIIFLIKLALYKDPYINKINSVCEPNEFIQEISRTKTSIFVMCESKENPSGMKVVKISK